MTLEQNLEAAAGRLLGIMLDRCAVFADTAGTADDVWDQVTRRYVAADPELIYRGPCMVSIRPGLALRGADGVLTEVAGTAMLPLGVAGLEPGQRFVVEESRDPAALDRDLMVRNVGAGTFAVGQQLGLVDRDDVQATPPEP